jgi:hypothetical protein
MERHLQQGRYGAIIPRKIQSELQEIGYCRPQFGRKPPLLVNFDQA